MKRVTISAPDDLVGAFEATVGEMGYTDRSKALQAAMRHFVSDHKWSGRRGNVAGALMVVYDSHARGLEEALAGLQHRYEGVVRATLHVHLDEGTCLQLVAVKGPAGRLKGLEREVAGRKGVREVRLTVTG